MDNNNNLPGNHLCCLWCNKVLYSSEEITHMCNNCYNKVHVTKGGNLQKIKKKNNSKLHGSSEMKDVMNKLINIDHIKDKIRNKSVIRDNQINKKLENQGYTDIELDDTMDFFFDEDFKL